MVKSEVSFESIPPMRFEVIDLMKKYRNQICEKIECIISIHYQQYPRDPWDWYIYPHLVAFYGKCR